MLKGGRIFSFPTVKENTREKRAWTLREHHPQGSDSILRLSSVLDMGNSNKVMVWDNKADDKLKGVWGFYLSGVLGSHLG